MFSVDLDLSKYFYQNLRGGELERVQTMISTIRTIRMLDQRLTHSLLNVHQTTSKAWAIQQCTRSLVCPGVCWRRLCSRYKWIVTFRRSHQRIYQRRSLRGLTETLLHCQSRQCPSFPTFHHQLGNLCATWFLRRQIKQHKRLPLPNWPF